MSRNPLASRQTKWYNRPNLRTSNVVPRSAYLFAKAKIGGGLPDEETTAYGHMLFKRQDLPLVGTVAQGELTR